jgi:hypothetical protein
MESLAARFRRHSVVRDRITQFSYLLLLTGNACILLCIFVHNLVFCALLPLCSSTVTGTGTKTLLSFIITVARRKYEYTRG